MSVSGDFLQRGHCTATAVDGSATADGGCIAATSADGTPMDFRLVYIPPKTYGPNGRRAIYKQFQSYPRIVDPERAPSYAPANPKQELSKPIGYIDMPEGKTYGYWEAAYGLMNEAGVCMGESSCSGRLTSLPVDEDANGALFWIGELASVALELCSTARGAIETMGRLAEEHGFYGTTEVEEAGEALTVADGDEAWVFHVLADDTGKGAVWAAEKVPKGHATIVPNVFVIRGIDPKDSENFIFSKNMYDVANRLGWWDGIGLLDFTRTFSVGEYNHPYYAGRRLWRAFSLWAPSQNFDPKLGVEVDCPTYPFSVKPDKPITLDQMRHLYRDHMEGTKYDLTNHVTSGGPFRTPNRYAESEAENSVKYGAWERAISLFRTQYAYIAVAYKGKPGVLHFAIGAPHASVFVPIVVMPNPTVTSIPALENTWQGEFNEKSLWWAVLSVSNTMDLKWCYMVKDVQKAQKEAEDELDKMMKTKSPEEVEKETPAICDDLTRRWFKLHYTLLGKYQNGYTDWGYAKAGYGPGTGWLKAACFDKFDATKQQFDGLRERYVKAQGVADAIRHRDE